MHKGSQSELKKKNYILQYCTQTKMQEWSLVLLSQTACAFKRWQGKHTDNQ